MCEAKIAWRLGLSTKCLDYLVYLEMLFPKLLVIHCEPYVSFPPSNASLQIQRNTPYLLVHSYLIRKFSACVLIYVIMVCHTKPWLQSLVYSQLQKNEKPFFEKTWNGRFGKKQSVSYMNVLFIVMLQMICIQAPRKFMTWGEHVFKVPEEFDFSNAIFIWSTLRT